LLVVVAVAGVEDVVVEGRGKRRANCGTAVRALCSSRSTAAVGRKSEGREWLSGTFKGADEEEGDTKGDDEEAESLGGASSFVGESTVDVRGLRALGLLRVGPPLRGGG
jgi:hypothetical protein